MTHLQKPFYHIDEVLERWSISERDMMAFVLAGSLTVSATVAGLRVTYGLCRPSAAGITDRIATSHSYIIGLVPLQRSDAWRVFKQGEFAITTLLAPPEEFAMIDNAAGNNQHGVQKVDLVIAHDELVRFEKANPAIMGTSTTGDISRRGAPSQFDWDDIWVELCAVIYLDGLPEHKLNSCSTSPIGLKAMKSACPTTARSRRRSGPCGSGCGRNPDLRRKRNADDHIDVHAQKLGRLPTGSGDPDRAGSGTGNSTHA